MLRNKLFCGMIVGVCLIGLVGCSDDDNPTGTGNGAEAPEFSIINVSVPDAMVQSSDPMAQLAVSYVSLANSISTWTGFFTPPAGAAKLVAPAGVADGPWVYTWSEEGLTVTLTITESSQNYMWSVVFDGTDGETTYDNFTFIDAAASKDGSSGSLVIYDPMTESPALDWTWSETSSGVYNFLMTSYDSEGFQIALTVNADKSGTLEFRMSDGSSFEPLFGSEWQSDGSGDWWNYADGEITDSGSWM